MEEMFFSTRAARVFIACVAHARAQNQTTMRIITWRGNGLLHIARGNSCGREGTCAYIPKDLTDLDQYPTSDVAQRPGDLCGRKWCDAFKTRSRVRVANVSRSAVLALIFLLREKWTISSLILVAFGAPYCVAHRQAFAIIITIIIGISITTTVHFALLRPVAQ
jgi:hypothetical protein